MSIFTKKVNQQKSEVTAKPWTDSADFFMNIVDHKRPTKEIILQSEKTVPDKWLVGEGVVEINEAQPWNVATFIGTEVHTNKKISYKDITVGIEAVPPLVGGVYAGFSDHNSLYNNKFVGRIHVFSNNKDFKNVEEGGVLLIEYIKPVSWVNKEKDE